MKSEQAAREILSALAKLEMPEQKQQEIRETIAAGIEEPRPVTKHRRSEVSRTGGAVVATLLIVAVGFYAVSNVRSMLHAISGKQSGPNTLPFQMNRRSPKLILY